MPTRTVSPLSPLMTRTQSSTSGLSVVNMAIRLPSLVIANACRPAAWLLAVLLLGAATVRATAVDATATVAASFFLIPAVIVLPPGGRGVARVAHDSAWPTR